MKDPTNIPVGGENLYRRVGGPGYPMMLDVKYDRPTWQPLWEDEHEVIPRDGYGCVFWGLIRASVHSYECVFRPLLNECVRQ